MSGYVVDANVLVGMLISGKASHRQLLRFFDFSSPDFVFKEIEKYQAEIIAKTKLDEQQLSAHIYTIFSNMTVPPSMFLSEKAKYQAAELVFDIDPKDVSYVALALQLDTILLTNDKKLVSGLKLKRFRKVLLWEDFLRSL